MGNQLDNQAKLEQLKKNLDRHSKLIEENKKKVGKLSKLFDSSSYFSISYSLSRGIIDCFGKPEKRLGYTAQNLKSTPNLLNELIHPDELSQFNDTINSFTGAKEKPFELRLKSKTGIWKWTLCTLVDREKDIDDKDDTLLILFRDISERKKLEDEIRISDERWKFALKNAGDGVWDWNIETNEIFFLNNDSDKFGSWDNNSDGFNDWMDRIHNDDREKVQIDLQDCLSGKTEQYSNLHRVIISENSFKWILGRGKILSRDDEGKPLRMIGTVTDLTERVEMEKKLNESKKMLAETGGLAKVGGWSIDAAQMKLECTEQMYEICELNDDKTLTLETMLSMFPQEYHNSIKNNIDAALSDGKSFDMVIPFLSAKGNNKHVRLNGKPYIENNNIVKIIGALQDITGIKKLENAVEKSDERLRLALASVGDVLWDWNIKSDEVHFSTIKEKDNNASDTFYVKSLDEWMKLKHPDDIEAVLSAAKMHIQRETAVYRSIHRVEDSAAGGYKWVLDRGSIIDVDENGNATRMMGTHTDITEQIENEILLEKNRKELEETNKTKDKLFSIIGHDLINPIHGIMSYASIISKQCEAGEKEKIQDYLDKIKVTTRSAQNIVEDVLTWARTQSGRLKSNPVNIQVLNSVNTVVYALSTIAEKKKITVNVDIDETLVIKADWQMLHTILRNLTTNAIKFTKENGVITISAIQKNGGVEFCVKDNGVGIPEGIKEKLFKVGENVSMTGTYDEKGTGLGLIICKEFVEEHGGKIRIESTVGEGTSVFFTIPQE